MKEMTLYRLLVPTVHVCILHKSVLFAIFVPIRPFVAFGPLVSARTRKRTELEHRMETREKQAMHLFG